MFVMKCDVRRVKQAFVLAESHKLGPFLPDEFRASLKRKHRLISKYTDAQLDEQITDPERLRRFNHASWMYTVVDLKNCSVWPTRGALKWAKGPISKVAEEVRVHTSPADRIWSMVQTTTVTLFDLPLIVLRRVSNPKKYRIDDGGHRAVAYYLAGFHQAPAFVGRVDEEFNLKWPWSGA